MAGKKVGFRPKPTQPTPDDWVQSRVVPQEETTELETTPEPLPPTEPEPAPTQPKKKMKRLTLDIPEELHKEMKMLSIQEGKPMVDLIVEMMRERLAR